MIWTFSEVKLDLWLTINLKNQFVCCHAVVSFYNIYLGDVCLKWLYSKMLYRLL